MGINLLLHLDHDALSVALRRCHEISPIQHFLTGECRSTTTYRYKNAVNF